MSQAQSEAQPEAQSETQPEARPQAQIAPADLRDIVLGIVELASVDVVATRLARAAMQITGADYAALGAYDQRHHLEHFSAVGLSVEEREQIGHPPHGLGLIGEFARNPRTINVASAGEHPSAAGTPDRHPSLGPFLGVPVVYGAQVIGAFYVARMPGTPPFTTVEQEQLEQLAPYAAIATANARTLELEHRRAAAAEVIAEAARGLQDITPERQAAEVLGDALGALFPDAAELAICWRGHERDGCRHPPGWEETALSRALDAHLAEEMNVGLHSSAELLPGRETTIQVARLESSGRLALAVAEEQPMSGIGRVSLRTLAELGAIGLTAQRRRDAESALERYAVRDEIARDLHDDLIQSIYAVGLSLRAARSAEPETIRAALAKASDDLNTVIRDLRSYISHLSRGPEELSSAGVLAARIESLLHEAATEKTRWSADIQLHDRPLGRKVERQLYLVVREAVSNVVRHADASSASLLLERRGGTLHLEIADDGRGFDRSTAGQDTVGLRSIEERVADLGGSIVIASTPGQGTSLIATFPIAEAGDD